MLLQQLVGVVDEAGVQRLAAMQDEVFDRCRGVARHAQRHGGFGVLQHLGLCTADGVGIGRVSAGTGCQQLGERAIAAKPFGQCAHRGLHFVELDGFVRQLRQQGHQVARGFKVEQGLAHGFGHVPHRLHRTGKLVLLDQVERHHDAGQPLQARIVRVLVDQAHEVVMAALQAFAVGQLQPHKGQQHQCLRVKHLGVQTQAHCLVEQLFRFFVVACIEGHHGQVLQATDGGRRQCGGHFVGLQRLVKTPQLKVRAAHHVVGIGVAGVFADQALQGAGGLVELPGLQQRAGYAQLGPGQGLGVHHGLVQGLRLGAAAYAQQQLGPHARGIEPEHTFALKAIQAQLGGFFKALVFDGAEDLLQGHLADAGGHQPVPQLGGFVGLEHVAIQRRLGRFGHLGVGGLTGDHDEDRGKRQQLVAAQVVQQVLARGVVAREVLLAQHKIKRLEFELPTRIHGACCLGHRGHTKIAQLRHQNRARGGVAVHNQGGAGGEIVF